MKKSDLKTGMKVVTRDGSVYIVLKGIQTDYADQYYKGVTDLFVNPKLQSYSWTSFEHFDENLCDNQSPEYDIMEVSLPGHPYDIFYQHNGYRVIWTREEKSESQKQLDTVMEKLAELQKEAEQLQETIKKEKK